MSFLKSLAIATAFVFAVLVLIFIIFNYKYGGIFGIVFGTLLIAHLIYDSSKTKEQK